MVRGPIEIVPIIIIIIIIIRARAPNGERPNWNCTDYY